MLVVGSIVIRVDPEGNRFCVVAAADWSGWAAHR
ncbi:hypothetical protein C7474_0791 [Microbacterium telephonicum]|uniref:Glyoxalase-like domain-containing protein n=1 Tax=Microbacterium telephonicum TaxID=1714841 RepID=A0A498CBJ5_9MICO|nr:hypothetical protein C7474_0791 [Microbacterium telephonicum]